jgi:hypothetical protein
LQGLHEEEEEEEKEEEEQPLQQPDEMHAQRTGTKEQEQAAQMVSEASATRLSRYVVKMLKQQLHHQSLIGAPLYCELDKKQISELNVRYVPPRSYVDVGDEGIDRSTSVGEEGRTSWHLPDAMASTHPASSSNFRHMLVNSSKRIFSRQKSANTGRDKSANTGRDKSANTASLEPFRQKVHKSSRDSPSAEAVDGDASADSTRPLHRPAKGYEEAPWAKKGARVFHARALTAALAQLRALPISGLKTSSATDDVRASSAECTFQDVLDLCNEVGIRVYIIGGFLRDYFAQKVDRIADIDLLFAADEGGLRRLCDRAKVLVTVPMVAITPMRICYYCCTIS